jgi:hypothetical protein
VPLATIAAPIIHKERDMLQQIVLKTPVWVWFLLAFLIYRGLLASAGRETRLKRIFLIPAAMLALTIHAIATTFGAHAAAAPLWLAGMAAGTALSWGLFSLDSVSVYPERATVFEQGSWMPLMLMLGIFLTRYGVAVALTMAPQLAQDLTFAAIVCALYGVFNGLFIGRLLRIVAIYRAGVARTYKLL